MPLPDHAARVDREPTAAVSVVIVNFHTISQVAASLASLRQHLDWPGLQVVVVDNSPPSVDSSGLAADHPGMLLVEADDNLGFGRACNVGARASRGEVLWFLNPDTRVPREHGLDRLLAFLDRNPRYGAAIPMLVDRDGRYQPGQCEYFPSVTRSVLIKAAGVIPAWASRPRWVSTLLGAITMDHLPCTERDVDAAAGASLFIRRSVFEEVGGFSEDFFLYFEDTDLCRKLRAAGRPIRFLPDCRIEHDVSGSIDRYEAKKRYYYASQELYYGHWRGRGSLAALRVLREPVAWHWRRRGRISQPMAGPGREADNES